MLDASVSKPLSGKRVFEIACVDSAISLRRAVAFCGRIAADLGAEVVCVASDGAEGNGLGSAFLTAGKAVHVGTLSDIEAEINAADALITCDGEIEYPAGPAHIAISLLPEGVDPRPASAFTLMASAGLLDIVGDPGREPLRLAGSQLDYAAGLSAYTAMAALLAGGRGGRARVSLLDVATWLNWKSLVVAHEGEIPPSRKGRDSEWQVLRCRDGWVAFVYRAADWEAVKKLIGNPRLDASELNIRANRKRQGALIADLAEERFLSMTRAEIIAFARAHRIPMGPVLSPAEIIECPQYLERRVFHTIDGADGPVKVPRVPVGWGDRVFMPGPVPAP